MRYCTTHEYHVCLVGRPPHYWVTVAFEPATGNANPSHSHTQLDKVITMCRAIDEEVPVLIFGALHNAPWFNKMYPRTDG